MAMAPAWRNVFENVAEVQFQHRMIGYAVVAFALWRAWRLGREAEGSGAARRATVVAGLALAQATLGIATLLAGVPMDLALPHQALAFFLLGAAAVDAERCGAEADQAEAM
ncbi:MAG: COX15/CtaA family protein, partial [Hyphomicrobiales bacterium]|nr:COX15/CtaA family protein [Hyphomicrobiales bacterium]